MTPKEKLIVKIKSLLSLASDISTTQPERDLALRNAQLLMSKYTISIAETESRPELIETSLCSNKPRGFLKTDPLYHYIISRIAQNFGVYTFVKGGAKLEGVWMMGFSTNLIIADYVINSLFTQGWIDYKQLEIKNAGSCMNFWAGFLEGLKIKFTKLSDERALVLYDKVKVAWLEKCTLKSQEIGRSTSSGFNEGSSSAINSSIRSGVGSANKGNLIG